MRLRIDLAYDGTDFRGWAVQPGLRTVQGELEGWIGQVLRLTEPPTLVVAGRTDAGVHARGQVCHVDLPDAAGPDPDVTAATLHRRLTRVLGSDVVVQKVSPAPAGFDARFSALWRRYCYRISDDSAPADPLMRGHVARVRYLLDLDTLNASAATLVGLRDFAAFCRPREGATTIRELRELRASRRGDGVIEVHLLADAFCHSMVRSLVGALTAVAAGRRSQSWLELAATSPSRHNEINVMPAHGLTLEEVGYPPDDELASRADVARAVRTLDPDRFQQEEQ
ncbi:tRNA pseudouridine(38-40) synthase TruA [Tessaracoccus flavus]|uniref:tRNA pseudouridine synthase A n=1 Tax=Tessaracoccus flavus TaxID=1610493 RepID=A0A1Q2CCY1_9ACTN|nr:tRNA pseudouridine(38-40) synthase TruA [Tessaracoccus flavus]AQP43983.1 tRNA pseudouridine(38-40) synthase TruA [Tessaracoccus flavus]SDY30904.1 tRNA pseudouridine38-40 synthase [Tessaracoccus flavus]